MAELPPGLQKVLQKQAQAARASSKSSEDKAIVPEPVKKQKKVPKRQTVCNNPKKWEFHPTELNWAVSCDRLKNYITGLVYSDDPNAVQADEKHTSKKHKKSKKSKKHSKKHKKGKPKKTVLRFGVAPFYPRIPGFLRVTDGDVLNLEKLTADSKEVMRTIDLSEYNARTAEWEMIKSPKGSEDSDASDSNEKEPTLEEFRELLKSPTGVLVSEDTYWRMKFSIVDHPTVPDRAVLRLDKLKIIEPVPGKSKPEIEAKIKRRLNSEVAELLEFNQQNGIVAEELPAKRVRRSRFSTQDMKLLLYNGSEGDEEDDNSLGDDSVEIPVEEEE
jgi:hypothetical protein